MVSVRTAEEARRAVEAGADLIDIKEPRAGALGPAKRSTIEAVADAVADQVPLSVALGELLEWDGKSLEWLPEGVRFAKTGLAGCARVRDWQVRWRSLTSTLPCFAEPVLVIYADAESAAAPWADEVLETALVEDCPAVLIDTFDKAGGDLFSHCRPAELAALVADIHGLAALAAVAGSLTTEGVSRVAQNGADFAAVRRSVCREGREGTLDASLVRQLATLLRDGHDAASTSRRGEIAETSRIS
ncbi:MAG: hypothetical protein DWQ31_15475 [Planctomycetota bacterium]|nr:MAG: hypothetical protein DWQ31_15475 [Planctomycetota bacterium]